MAEDWRGAQPPDRRLDTETVVTGPFTSPWDAPLFPPFPMRFRDVSILTVIPHIDGTPAIRQLTARRLQELEVTGCWTGPCSVELRPNAQAPLYRLPVLEPLAGYFWRASFTLVAGRILHDYLAPDR